MNPLAERYILDAARRIAGAAQGLPRADRGWLAKSLAFMEDRMVISPSGIREVSTQLERFRDTTLPCAVTDLDVAVHYLRDAASVLELTSKS